MINVIVNVAIPHAPFFFKLTAKNPADGTELVHYYPALKGSTAWGSDLGTDNDDGSYTFNGSAANYSGGGAVYYFPQPKENETWNLEDYDFVEVYLTISDGAMTQVVRKSGPNGGNSIDAMAYPDGGGNYMALAEGNHTFKLAVAELRGGIGFQRGQGGPSTWAITKAVYTKGATWHTITFTNGIDPETNDPVVMEAIDPLEVLDGRPVNFNSNNFYKMPANPRSSGYTFNGWYNETDSAVFAGGTITHDLILKATWVVGERELVDIDLELDPDEWDPVLPGPPSGTSAATYTYANDALTIKFTAGTTTGNYIAGIPLTADQVAALLVVDSPIMITINGDVTIGGVTDNTRTFRFHLAKFDSGQDWNATDTGVSYIAFSAITEGQDYSWHVNKSAATLASLRIQIQNPPATGADDVLVTIRSVNIKELD